MDKLEDIFDKQKELQLKLGNSLEKIEMNIDFIKMNFEAIIVEMSEFLMSIPWKPWKIQQKWDIENAKLELIDVLHFWMNLCIALKMTPEEIHERYLNKQQINIKRKEEGY